MQWNQPYGQVAFENIPNNVYYQTNTDYAPPFRAIGEGEVTSIYIPDGSTQMYFIPTIRYDRWSPQYNINFPNVDNFHKNLSTDYWFVRSVSFPISTSFNNHLPNPCGNSIPTQPFTPNYTTNLPLCQTEYYQKFHNDNATSTTDITYFYPSLRLERISHNSTLVQTNKPSANYNISYDGVKKCPCKVSFRVEKEIRNKCMCQESVSSMSVDSVSTPSENSIKRKKKHVRSKRKSKNKTSKRRGIICKCSDDAKETSDKLVTTYMDTASGNVESKGRDTQTSRNSKRNDIKPEVWIPRKRKSATSPKSSTNTIDQLFSLTTSDDCACVSCTDTDSQ
ncbi:uncharacterized protein LOC126773163 [Nymphalis io]|uniref:uncharacterized protein LOC126773163 n=1 Tax=Inachis io TaxID=171585 RepID=UPI002167A2DE|nr:uncharacterized protein LOC126773163 [Nymphalis io]